MQIITVLYKDGKEILHHLSIKYYFEVNNPVHGNLL